MVPQQGSACEWYLSKDEHDSPAEDAGEHLGIDASSYDRGAAIRVVGYVIRQIVVVMPACDVIHDARAWRVEVAAAERHAVRHVQARFPKRCAACTVSTTSTPASAS